MGRLVSAANRKKSESTEAMFTAIRNDLAERCEAANQPRDYAQLIRALIDVTEQLGKLNGDITDGRKQGSTKTHHTSPLDQAKEKRGNLKVVNG